jgi:glycosyltransferase involved in cell wall biosynthesis
VDNKKRIGYLSGAPRVSTRPEAVLAGPRSHVLGVMRAFEKLGWGVRPFIVGDGVPLGWVAGEQSETAMRSSRLVRLGADLVRLQMGIVNGWRARRELQGVDWVYERFGSFQALGWWFHRRGIPWILETNALPVQDRSTVAMASLARLTEFWAYRKCDVLVCVSQTLADLLIRQAGVDPGKIVVVLNGVDTEYFDPLKHSPKRLFDSPTVGFVGRLAAWHQLSTLIEALAELREEATDFKLVVVGDGPMREAWENLTRATGQVDHVRFVGQVPRSEVPAYIAGFDLGYLGQVPLAAGELYLSPLKLYEYAAMARPTVASAFADTRQLVEKGSMGYLFTAGDKTDLKRALRLAYAQRDRWTEMGARARKLVAEHHSWEVRVQEMIRRLELILETKYGSPHPARRTG